MLDHIKQVYVVKNEAPPYLKKIDYKDGYRCWWTIELTATTETITDCCGDVHKVWHYKLIHDGTVVAVGDCVGKYDCEPSEIEVVTAISRRFDELFLGMAKYGKWEI